jgi:hypothetical protein
MPASRASPLNGDLSDVVFGGPSWLEYQRASMSKVEGCQFSAASICSALNGAMMRLSSSKTSI